MLLSFLGHFLLFLVLFIWIDMKFHIRPLLELYFTKKWNNLPEYTLYSLNLSAYNLRNSEKIKDKIYIFTVKKINERNKYIYVHKNTNG